MRIELRPSSAYDQIVHKFVCIYLLVIAAVSLHLATIYVFHIYACNFVNISISD